MLYVVVKSILNGYNGIVWGQNVVILFKKFYRTIDLTL